MYRIVLFFQPANFKIITNEMLLLMLICMFYFRIEEAKRAIKRTSADNDRYNELDRKRPANDRRFEPPPPPRFDTAIRSSNYDRPPEKKRVDDYPTSSSKRNDDYKSSSRGGTGSMGNSDVSSFKRPINDGYKRSNDIEPPSRSGGGGGGSGSGGYDQRSVVSSMGSSTKDNRFNDSVDNRHLR